MTERERAIIRWALLNFSGMAFERFAFANEGDVNHWKATQGSELPTEVEVLKLADSMEDPS